MSSRLDSPFNLKASDAIFADGALAGQSVPIKFATSAGFIETATDLSSASRAWLTAVQFKPSQRRAVALADGGGQHVATVVGAAPASNSDDPMAAPALAAGLVAQSLPAATYRMEPGAAIDHDLASVAFGLGGYRFRRYKTANGDAMPRLVLPTGVDQPRVRAIVDGVSFARDLINTPSNDMGPAELEAAARFLAAAHGAQVSSIVGDDLLAANFPLIHAVGRASPRAPRLIDMSWGNSGPRVTLVGKGICFDTGGLDIKPASSMLLMKKDMGGAASVLALAHMLMATKTNVRLRVLIAAAENSVAGDAFRPSDVIKSRAGMTVEIGNTDAEGRLVLADALSLADEERPDLLATFSTLTGAARTALGPDLAPFYSNDDAFATKFTAAGNAVGDPVWRMPFWSGYDAMLDSPVADFNNVSESPFAGSIVAALFLKRFVKASPRFLHLDIYGWRPAAKALGPRGGEATAARALFETIRAGAL